MGARSILFTGWRGVAVGLFAALSCLLAVSLAVDQTRLSGLFGSAGSGKLGLESDAIVGRAGWALISRVTAGGAAANAGLAPGMIIHFDHAYEAHADLAVGRKIGMIVRHDATFDAKKGRHLTLEALPTGRFGQGSLDQPFVVSIIFAAWLSVTLGMVAILRGWGSPSAVAFGLGILSYIITIEAPSWATTPLVANSFLCISALPRSCIVALLLLPAMLYAERIGRPQRGWMWVFGLLGGSVVALNLFAAWCEFDEARYPFVGDGQLLMPVCVNLSLLMGLYWGWRGWRDAIGADRGRFTALLATSVIMVLTELVDLAIGLSGEFQDVPLLLIAPMVLTNVIIPLVLAYAVLRHRVVDLGFALNRTVVYGTFSAILLGSFGLIEWGVEHLLPEEWVKASAWIDAGAAVMVYLAFHRVHDAVEHRVEHLFFGQWQTNEDALRRFVASAVYFEDTRALAHAFADELARFGGGARVALYQRDAAVLNRVAGTWDTAPRHFREDDPAFALMRAERAPLDLGETRTDLPGVLALPMLDHGALAGLVLLDLKGNGGLYRPDEVALFGWAAHEVGLALAALQAGLIETENRLLKAQLARLGSIIGDRLDRVGA
jgi:hypothetical protein